MDALDWMGSAMRAARAQLDVAAENLANVSTDGYRRTAADVALTAAGLVTTSRTGHDQGAVRTTGRTFDLALLGDGTFRVGENATRSGAFTRDRTGRLVDDRGRALHGAHGPLRVSPEAKIEADGSVRDHGRVVDRIPLPRGTHILAGALETSTVNAITETLSILTAQRSFETAQKTLLAVDATRQKAANDVARVQ
ncbi:MAG TPA: flagellar basal body rod C-terminal domain-containing protein [Candidatus Elarobacter sp.]|jgi:flagellar basal-body rod protein FlgG|nr:flagellar basal body rod C-terminal domain-containing protein [Candidatus Elarobacter sp.]